MELLVAAFAVVAALFQTLLVAVLIYENRTQRQLEREAQLQAAATVAKAIEGNTEFVGQMLAAFTKPGGPSLRGPIR